MGGDRREGGTDGWRCREIIYLGCRRLHKWKLPARPVGCFTPLQFINDCERRAGVYFSRSAKELRIHLLVKSKRWFSRYLTFCAKGKLLNFVFTDGFITSLWNYCCISCGKIFAIRQTVPIALIIDDYEYRNVIDRSYLVIFHTICNIFHSTRISINICIITSVDNATIVQIYLRKIPTYVDRMSIFLYSDSFHDIVDIAQYGTS